MNNIWVSQPDEVQCSPIQLILILFVRNLNKDRIIARKFFSWRDKSVHERPKKGTHGLYRVSRKNAPQFLPKSLATNMLEGWDIIHWKGGIHSFVWSTKTFLCDIWEPRYKQNSIGYQISKCLNIGQSKCLEIWCPIFFYLYFGSLIFKEMGLNFQHAQ